uniref:EGF-like domain-containing protein n=1 Tax=Meloidogyne enterolobii TaxID=390850 RepID=A0A6V7VGU7_MELEN|nr:unnamed protein product [Meloidogyne enterolobii]
MGEYYEPSFKDVKLLNRLYCTREYPHKRWNMLSKWENMGDMLSKLGNMLANTLSKSIDLECDVKEYELNYGKCKNGGYPDPLKKCKCLCPRGYGGDDCTEYEYDNCRVIKLTAKVKKQYISAEFGRGKCFFTIKLEQNNDKIKAKRIIITIEKLEGFDCKTYCENNYIEIKYLKDKTATGAKLCCIKHNRLLTINSEDDTEVLIMKKGNIGEYDISYQKELAPSQDSSNCKEVRKSIWDPNNLQTRQELYVLDEKGNLLFGPDGKMIVKQYFGPRFCLGCHRKDAMIVCFMFSLVQRFI